MTTVASDVEPQALVDDKTAPSADNSSNAGANEPRRRAAPNTSPRAEANATAPNAAVGTAVDKSAPQAAEPSARASNAAEGATRVAGKSAATRNEALASILGRPHSGVGGANRSASAGGEEELPRIDPARFIGRVAKAFHTAHERGSSLQLRLSPPELGSLRLELSVKDGVMIAALETETHSARRVLLDHLPALRDRLAEQNIRVERFDVDVRRDGGGSQGNQNAPQHQQHDHQPDQPPPRRQPATAPLSGGSEKTTPAQINTDNSQINLVA
jgi:flagellar hook-length control protein FliK